MLPPNEIAGAFRARPADANKYSVGTVAVVGGSGHYLNAPVIAALGARAAGAGLVRLVVPDASRIGAATLVPEATFTKLTPTFVPPKADVTVAGMGLGQGMAAQAIVSRLISGTPGRFVLDADALTVLSGWYGAKGGYAPAAGQPGAAKAIAKRYGAIAVLKGARTIVVSPDGSKTFENPTGNPFMALGGMGDLLAGVIGARWAYIKTDAFLAVSSAVWLHGAAGDGVVSDAIDPSVANIAARLGSMRVRLDR